MEEQIKNSYNFTLQDKYLIDDLESRRVFLNDEISAELLDNIAYHIMRYNGEDAKNKVPINKRKPILLFINTLGGEVGAGFSLVDIIIASKTPVYTINMANCMSMGFLIFLAGKKRYAFKHSTFLMHDGNVGTIDSTAKAKDRIDFETIQVEAAVKEYIISRTKITEKTYKEQYRVEWYMFSKEAKKYGVCTDIIGEDVDMSELW